MPNTLRTLALAIMLAVAQTATAPAAEREQVRMVINLISGVKMPFPEHLRNNLARTQRVQLDTNGATVACLRLDDKIRWCYEHIAPVGARAEMLRIRNEPVQGLVVGQLYHYVDDLDLDEVLDRSALALVERRAVGRLDRVDQVVGDVDSGERLVETRARDGVAGDDVDLGGDALGRAGEHAHVVACALQRRNQCRADEAGRTSDESGDAPTVRYGARPWLASTPTLWSWEPASSVSPRPVS